MSNARLNVPAPVNEPNLTYAPGTPERAALKAKLSEMHASPVDIPAIIGGREVRTGRTGDVKSPHDHSANLGVYHRGGAAEAQAAVDAALAAGREWAALPWTERAAVFLRAAALLTGPWRQVLNGATMLGQSKNPFQAEIDSACETIDFWRFNAHFMAEMYGQQPISSPGMWNRLEYRPLEGFVFAVTPFNFTSIGANLPTAPALMGCTVVWKPASTSILSAYWTMKLLEAAGLPPGVINLVPGDGAAIGDPVLASPHLAGLHFTGSTGTFQHMWRTIGTNIERYRTYPRIVGETGGKDFIVAHASADPDAVATAIVRGGFEYQGQKCSAASRAYIPDTLWPRVKASITAQLAEIKMGPVEDFSNFVNAVIDGKSFQNITGYIEQAKRDGVEVVAGGGSSDRDGWFVEPTVLRVDDPGYRTMCEEIFGPVVTLHVYPEARFAETLDIVDRTSPYALTGSIFADDRYAVDQAMRALVNAAGNFYINDKPTGAVVGQQPFGGARASGTNDKAGSALNLARWVSARSIKETFDPPRHFGYPFLRPDA
ncbi:MAG: L-glutamate gamma-semialdehyde dehydrogenase [Anaerolineae bacterium]